MRFFKSDFTRDIVIKDIVNHLIISPWSTLDRSGLSSGAHCLVLTLDLRVQALFPSEAVECRWQRWVHVP